jgi:hypothetical protein
VPQGAPFFRSWIWAPPRRDISVNRSSVDKPQLNLRGRNVRDPAGNFFARPGWEVQDGPVASEGLADAYRELIDTVEGH